MGHGDITSFVDEHFRHFNARGLADAARAYAGHLADGGKMLVSIAGAMSTAELGRSLAPMIREHKVHAICCTGANIEEDLFGLLARQHYVEVPDYRHLSPADEVALHQRGLNRITDICIPEVEAIERVANLVVPIWRSLDAQSRSAFFHESLYTLAIRERNNSTGNAATSESWLVAAAEQNLPVFVPGWEDSTLGNRYAAEVMNGGIRNLHTIKSGTEYMLELIQWYRVNARNSPIGFFQIGGGIAGDFAVSVVPLVRTELRQTDLPLWSYYCQVTDSITSYGSYSGAAPSEKITWGKLTAETRSFHIESDATIVAPLIFAYVLGW